LETGFLDTSGETRFPKQKPGFKRVTMRRAILVGAVMVLASIGCGGGHSEEVTRDLGDLKDLGRAYSAYQNATGKPPATLADLIDYQTKSGGVGLPGGIARMKVPWGAPFGSMYRDGEAAKTVFVSSSASNGVVPVLMADGSVTTVNQAELDSAKKVAAPKHR